MNDLRLDLFKKIMDAFTFIQVHTKLRGLMALHDIIGQAVGERKKLSECDVAELRKVYEFMGGDGSATENQ